MSPSEKRNFYVFVALCCGCIVAIIAFGVYSARRTHQSGPSSPTPQSLERKPASSPHPPPISIRDSGAVKADTRTLSKKTVSTGSSSPDLNTRLIYYRTNALGSQYGKLTVATLPLLNDRRYSPDLSCERLYFAGGNGVCLVADRGMFTSFYALTFNEHLQREKTISLNGEPSRVRISPDGHWAAITVFISGHSYSSLAFSTQTTIVDVRSGKSICDLEQFSVTRRGEVFKSPDFNFWGVTFAHDGRRFYATLWSSGRTYLVEGDLKHRTARVIYDDVECPSLSPDNTRIAFKKRIGPQQPGWHLHLLRLSNLTETALGETRNVDDQVEWLDNNHILYALSENPTGASASTDLWELATRAGASPQLFLKGAFSPAVVAEDR